jgi:hypothetical protein
MEKYSEHEEQDIVIEDGQLNEVEKITDDEELKAAKELLLEDIEKEEKKTDEPSQPVVKADEDNLSDEALEAKKKEAQSDESTKKADEKPADVKDDKQFTVTDEFIATQSDDVKALLTLFKGKGKADLAKAAAHAVALKNPYLKDDEKLIGAMQEKFENYTNDELVKTFIETQKETGKQTQEPPPAKSPVLETVEKIESRKDVTLPPIEETEEIKTMIDKQVQTRLKKFYEDIPEDTNSVEYREWKRDKMDEDPEKFQDFLQAKKEITSQVKTDLQKITYYQNNHKEINNNRYENEVVQIKEQLKSIGLTEKDLEVDLTLSKDEDGLNYNKVLDSYIRDGEDLDSKIVGVIGDKVFLKVNKDNKGLTPLAKKFLSDNYLTIASAIARKQVSDDKKEVERLKAENLNSLGDRKTGGKLPELLTTETIGNITDEDLLKRKKLEIENSFD